GFGVSRMDRSWRRADFPYIHDMNGGRGPALRKHAGLFACARAVCPARMLPDRDSVFRATSDFVMGLSIAFRIISDLIHALACACK
ncbi:hypothetical protein L7Q78_38360, partial [Achromobacter xylosoxidans]|nr:hypothetical protein [Achromobacter xylosoxidans]